MSSTQQLVQISEDPYSRADPFYRYKREFVRVEGKGSKSNVVNLGVISTQISVDPEYITKYFSYQFGTTAKYDKKMKSALIGKKVDAKQVDLCLQSLIESIVICYTCKRPEVDLYVSKASGKLKTNCRSCGKIHSVQGEPKLIAHITKQLESKKSKKQKKSKPDQQQREQQDTATLEDLNDDDWSLDTSAEAVAMRKLENRIPF